MFHLSTKEIKPTKPGERKYINLTDYYIDSYIIDNDRKARTEESNRIIINYNYNYNYEMMNVKNGYHRWYMEC